MPNRIIKESAFTSEKISELSDFQFRLWVGLITQADDAGRGDARPAIIKGRIFPLRDRVTAKDIESALHVLAAGGCVSLYMVGGKPYYQFPNWAAHQRVRDAKPKFPGEDEADELPPFAASRGELPPESNPIQSESNPNPNPTKAPPAPLDVAMERFAKHRKALRKPLTPDARALTLRELEKLYPGDEKMQIASIEQSIQRGWQGVFQVREDAKPVKKEGRVMDDTGRLMKMLGVEENPHAT